MKLRYTLIFAICFSAFAFSQNQSSIDFIIRNLGVNVDGHFETFDINAEFDSSQNLKKITGTIQVKSIETGIESRDEHLLEEDYFHAEKHKTITLKSRAITKKSNGNYIVKSNLTIKGKTKKITIPVKIEKQNGQYKIISNFEINRKDFNVGGSSFIMSKTARINVVHYQNL
ncbi:YceI family protein [Winogradskyella ursingii]|uniref:YceI family protein n=1 Tax=Winogradskyella ursingii TaxID=2686079 RepID=UPI0015CB6A0B|nr:YceI family protein [Winogradskyella ursingii]